MKECPTCSRVYADESLRFCLDDGSNLVSAGGPQPTIRINPPRVTVKPTEFLPGSRLTPAPRPQTQSLVPWLVTGAALLLVAVMGIGITILVLTKRPSTTSPNVNGTSAERKGASPAPTTTTQNEVINLLGTRWTQTSTISQMKEVTFNSNGIINSDPTDKWWQNGNTVIMEFTNGYARYEGTITGNRIDYKAHNKVNLDWTGTFYLVK
jgi:hypothetical protein